jgi:hypothetical protein
MGPPHLARKPPDAGEVLPWASCSKTLPKPPPGMVDGQGVVEVEAETQPLSIVASGGSL